MVAPPSSTLFPYTTLFRSNGFRQIVFAEVPCNWFQCQENSIDPVHFERDRKSTRLNSSHLVISYAVFCVKRKSVRVVRAARHLPATAAALGLRPAGCEARQ